MAAPTLGRSVTATIQFIASFSGRAGCRRSLSAVARGDQWHLMSAVCLQRMPVITQERSDMEEEFSQLLEKIEFENSHLSDHELWHLDDQRLAEKRKNTEYEESETEAVRQNAVEAEDAWEAELQAFTASGRTTEADEQNDLTSSDRLLSSKLVLLVKQKLGEQSHWVLPQRRNQSGETMRQSAEKALTELCGPNLRATYMGNAPCGFLKYRYPAGVAQSLGAIGAKVFFFKAQLKAGEVELSNDAVESHVWLRRADIAQYADHAYTQEVNKFVLDL